MFNNPFDSFHNTVAEAKEEREQLDRLLTISTPRERALVVVIGLLLAGLVAWLFLGSVARTIALDGVLIEPGEGPLGGEGHVQALVWIRNDVAPEIRAGLPAAMELGTAGGVARAGKVAAIAAIPSSGVSADLKAAAPISVHRIDIALDEGLDPGSRIERDCRIFIELGKQSPVALFGMGAP